MNRRRILQPLLAGLLLASGFAILWGMVVTLVAESVGHVVLAQVEAKSTVVQSDGTPLILSYRFGPSFKRTYHTLNGKPVERPPGSLENLAGATLRDGRSSSGVRLSWPMPVYSFVDAGTHPPVYWYLVYNGRSDGAAYFVGYDSDAKLPIGYIGLDGFSEKLQQQWFPIKAEMLAYGRGLVGRSNFGREPWGLTDRIGDWNVSFISEGRLLQVDLHERSVRTLLEAEGLCAIGNVELAKTLDAAPAETAFTFDDHMAVRTADRILLLDSKGTKQQSFAIPDGWHDRRFTFYALRDDRAMLTSLQPIGLSSDAEHDFVWIDGQGKVTDEKSVTLKRPSITNWPDVKVGLYGAVVPATAIVTPWLLVTEPRQLVDRTPLSSYSAAVSAFLPHCLPTLLAVNLLGVGLAIICYRRQKRFAQPHVWPWVVFVFLFGLPGMVGYLAHQRWPVREVCPKCKEQVPRDRDACAACDEPFPRPELKGIEVLS